MAKEQAGVVGQIREEEKEGGAAANLVVEGVILDKDPPVLKESRTSKSNGN